MTTKLTPVIVHVDESCLGSNPGKGGAAALLEFQKPDGEIIRRDVWYSEPESTNNRMAIMSATIALETLTSPCRVYLISDSQYLLKGIDSEGYKNVESPANDDLWQRLLVAMRGHELVLKWVRGHNGNHRNEFVDGLAKYAAENQTSQLSPVESSYIVRQVVIHPYRK